MRRKGGKRSRDGTKEVEPHYTVPHLGGCLKDERLGSKTGTQADESETSLQLKIKSGGLATLEESGLIGQGRSPWREFELSWSADFLWGVFPCPWPIYRSEGWNSETHFGGGRKISEYTERMLTMILDVQLGSPWTVPGSIYTVCCCRKDSEMFNWSSKTHHSSLSAF